MIDPSLFGILIVDRPPLGLDRIPGLLFAWLQDAGGFAAVGLLLYLLRTASAADQSARTRMPLTTGMLGCAAAALLCYAGFVALWAAGIGGEPPKPLPQPGESYKYEPPTVPAWSPKQPLVNSRPWLLAVGGLLAVAGIGTPFVRDLFKLRANRIWALSKVGFLEARRSPLFIVFLLFLGVFMFPAQWFIPTKAENELRLTLDVTSFTSTLLVMLPALILAAFRIPSDIKYQTIYTIVTKPVERFEVVLGRFFGYTFLMTVALGLMASLGLFFIQTSNIHPKAKEETYKARVPVRGALKFQSRRADFEGTNVGRELEYRKYISGHPNSSERAIWSFQSVPAGLLNGRTAVPCEMTFDIFRLTKGEENVGVYVNIRFVAHSAGDQLPPDDRSGIWKWADPNKGEAYRKAREAADEELKRAGQGSLADAKPGTPDRPNPGWEKANQLAKEHGFFELGSVEVYDYHPVGVRIPAGVIEAARAGDPGTDPATGQPRPRLKIYVKCLSPGQTLGMAEADLYLMETDRPFWLNYYKSTVGLWCRVTLLIGVAVAVSTYLSGIVSMLLTLFLYISAYFAEHLQDVANQTSTGGGPMESFLRLVRTDTPTAFLDQTAAVKTVTTGDTAFAWGFRRYINLVPDIEAFTWTSYLKEGFDISGEYLLVNLVVLVGYLLPWAVLSYYAIRNREVAA